MSSARERLPGAGSSRITQAADTRPSASKTTPSLSSSARFRCTAGAAAPHSPLNPPRRRSDAITRCQGTLVSAGQFLRITAPTDRAQPPATLATAPYVVTLPRGMPRTTACTLDSKAVGISLAARRRPQPRTALRDADALLLHSAASAACGRTVQPRRKEAKSKCTRSAAMQSPTGGTVPFGTAVRGLPAFAARMASLETRHCESRPKWMHGAKRSRSERRHDSVLPGFKCVCYAR